MARAVCPNGAMLWLGAILLVALSVRVAWVWQHPELPAQHPSIEHAYTHWDPAHYDQLAQRLSERRGYVDLLGRPTAYRAPGYPAFLGAMYATVGRSKWTVGIANAMLWSAATVLTYALACRLARSWAALAAAALVALWPIHIIRFTPNAWGESLYAVACLGFLLLALQLFSRPSYRTALLAGAALGAGCYVKPILLLFPLVVAGALMLHGLRPVRAAKLAAFMMAVAIVCTSPWAVRNFAVFGEVVWFSTNAGQNLFIGNGPGATGAYRHAPISIDERVPAAVSALDYEGRFEGRLELIRHREGMRRTVGHVLQHPGQWFALIPTKTALLWKHAGGGVRFDREVATHMWGIAVHVVHIGQVCWLAVLAGVGARAAACVWSCCRTRSLPDPATLLLFAVLVYWTLLHTALWGDGRFHMAVMPVAVVLVASWWRKDAT